MFGEALHNMIAVTDRHSAYFALNFMSHQICLAHILREVQYLDELDKKQQWSRDMRKLLKEAIHTRNENPQDIIDTIPWYKRLDELLKRKVEHLGEDFKKLKNGLIKYRDYVFKFLGNPNVPSNNNTSERGFRKLKVKQKISGTFRSEHGADAFFDLHSIFDTAHKNKQPELDAILAFL
jgi:transposase